MHYEGLIAPMANLIYTKELKNKQFPSGKHSNRIGHIKEIRY